MSASKGQRKRSARQAANRAAYAPLCRECGQRGLHFAPPSLGEPGFYTCVPATGSAT